MIIASEVLQALQQGLVAKAAPEVVHGEAGRLHSLLYILQALSDGCGPMAAASSHPFRLVSIPPQHERVSYKMMHRSGSTNVAHAIFKDVGNVRQ